MTSDSVPDLSVIVLSWNTVDYSLACLAALAQSTGTLDIEVIVIDNASDDDSAERIAQEYPAVRLIRNAENRGYALGVNQGLCLARGKKLCLLGSDTAVHPGALSRMAGFLDEQPRAGAVAPRLLNFDGSVQDACMRFPTLWTALVWDTALADTWLGRRELRRYEMQDWDHRGTRRIDQPPGTCVMLPRAVIEKIGLMDGRMWLFFNDVDWMKRLHHAGFEAWYLDDATVEHHLGGSTSRFGSFVELWHRNRIIYYRKHHGRLGEWLAKQAMNYVARRQIKRLKAELADPAEFAQHRDQIAELARQVRAMDANPALPAPTELPSAPPS